MSLKIPKIDQRGTEQIYQQAIKLVRVYCPEWKNIYEDTPDKEDLGLVLLRLFSKLAETVIGQINRIPEKHLLAFYDFIGIDHLPSAVAKAPLTFKLSEGSKMALAATRTKVSSSEDPTVIFETIEPLTVVNLNIKAAYSLNPWIDKYTNHGQDINNGEKEFYLEEGFYIFDGKDPVPHTLYLSDRAFDFKTPATVTIKFTFTKDTDFTKYFSKVRDGDSKPFLDESGNMIEPIFTPSASDKSMIVSFNKRMLIPKLKRDGLEANWISFSPKDALSIGDALPEINNITCDVTVDSIVPDATLFNNTPVDVKKGFYPFGETPKIGDAFYIGCDEAFSKKDAIIDINLNLKGGVASNDLNLSWEYWHGSKWVKFGINDDTNPEENPDNPVVRASVKFEVNDGTNGFIKTGEVEVTFQCPDIMTTEINGISSRWIRVRIESGGYGEVERYVDVRPVDNILDAIGIDSERKKIITDYLKRENITLGVKYIGPKNNPPLINSLTIGYSYKDKDAGGNIVKKVQRCKTYNTFEYKDIAYPFQPFVMSPEDKPTFYIGFENAVVNNPLSLYFSQKGLLYGEDRPRIEQPGYAGNFALNERVQGFMWEYYNGQEWIELAKEDDTNLFSKNGIVKFILPGDICKALEFGENLYWIKLVLKDGSWFEPPKLKGIFPNTVWAENASVIKDELLGSSNGEGNQVFTFSSRPLLGGQVIEIKEPAIPSESELQVIGSDALRIIKNDSGDIQEVWVRWHEIKSYVHSDSLSRHYIIDRVNGRIIFGDGIHGMIPPALPNNILAREYKSGGGRKGNQKEKTITGLKTTIPNIDRVTNYDSSSGGRDLEVIDDILIRTPHSIKNGGKAVTMEDFEWLAKEASPEVSKARCIRNGEKIQVIIAPGYENDRPSPDVALTDYVEEYLKERVFAAVKNNIEVVGPDYKSINVKTNIVPLSVSESAMVGDRVKRKLKEFLHPITGGQDGTGWDFGQGIFISEIAAMIEEVEGVDYIKELTVDNTTINVASAISIEENMLLCPGEITINLTGDKA